MESKKNPKKRPQISVPLDIQTHYANLVRITHSPSEFVFDFARMLPDLKEPQAQARVIVSPLSAKLFHKALGDNLRKFEARYGEIQLPGSSSLADSLFSPPDQ